MIALGAERVVAHAGPPRDRGRAERLHRPPQGEERGREREGEGGDGGLLSGGPPCLHRPSDSRRHLHPYYLCIIQHGVARACLPVIAIDALWTQRRRRMHVPPGVPWRRGVIRAAIGCIPASGGAVTRIIQTCVDAITRLTVRARSG